MNKILQIYKILHKNYGKQGWWPTTLEGERTPAYHGKGVLNNQQRFEIILGTILAQNTSWKNAEKAIKNLEKHNLINPSKILKTNKTKLAKLIKSSGYYNQKAERLKIISKFFLENKSPAREQLLNIKGIGNETADSILLYAYSKPFFVIDLYTKRIFSRLGLCSEKDDYLTVQELFTNNLPKNQKQFNEYHALIVKHAKMHCKKTPVCNGCPLAKLCSYAVK